jgi:hypothetical protein
MKVACYADDAKEPELIGEVVVPIEEALKKGEVDGEWPHHCRVLVRCHHTTSHRGGS